MKGVTEYSVDAVLEDIDLLRARIDRIEQLRSITFLGPNDPPLNDPPIEWHPDPHVRAKRGLARLREIKF